MQSTHSNLYNELCSHTKFGQNEDRRRELFPGLQMKHSIVGYIAHAVRVASVGKEGRRPRSMSVDENKKYVFLSHELFIKNG